MDIHISLARQGLFYLNTEQEALMNTRFEELTEDFLKVKAQVDAVVQRMIAEDNEASKMFKLQKSKHKLKKVSKRKKVNRLLNICRLQ